MKPEAHSIRPGLLALAFFASSSLSHAQTPPQTVPAPVEGDLFLGVRSAGGEGAADSYLVNLGPGATFTGASEGTSFDITTVNGLPIGDLAADLAAKYGADWHSRPDLFWGLFGTSNINNPALFGSKERPSPSTASTPWPALSLDDRKGTRNAIIDVVQPTGGGGYRGRLSTVNSLVATFQPNAANTTTYFVRVATPGTTDFSTFSSWSSIETTLSGDLDLYRISGSAATPVAYVGYFSVSGAGVITFTKPSSTPEPDPDADDDGDGFTNAEEEIAGTDPNNAADHFKVVSITNAPGSSSLSFRPAASRTYVLEYSEDLSPPWQDIGQYTAGATPPAIHELIDDDPVRTARNKGFYRIRVSRSTP